MVASIAAIRLQCSHIIMTKEERLKLVRESREAFIASMQSKTIAHGADIMPRTVWADGMIAALVASGIMAPERDDIEKAQAIFGSNLGNSSQLGTSLLKDGTIKMQGADDAAVDYAAELQKRLAPK